MTTSFQSPDGQAQWNGGDAQLDYMRELFRRVLPNGRYGHVFEDLDIIARAYCAPQISDSGYAAMLQGLAQEYLAPDDLAAIVAARQGLGWDGTWAAMETKRCRPSCDCSEPREAPGLQLQYAKWMTFRECLNLKSPRCRGFFLVHTEHKDPLASRWIYINGQLANTRQLILVAMCHPDLAGIEPMDLGEPT